METPVRAKTIASGLLGLLVLGLAQGACQGGGSAARAPVAAISAGRVPGKASPASDPAQSSLTKVADAVHHGAVQLGPAPRQRLQHGERCRRRVRIRRHQRRHFVGERGLPAFDAALAVERVGRHAGQRRRCAVGATPADAPRPANPAGRYSGG